MVITAALPYANGSIHIGHLVEYIQADIFVRFQKMNRRDCRYFCADDTHGAPIMIRAKKEGVKPEDIIERYHKEHQEDFSDFLIEFDNYHSTNSEENRILAEEIYTKLRESNHIDRREIDQTFCEKDNMFLPDRFIKGTCPKCGAEDQYGDVCESCGTHYDPTDLKDPKCAICQTPPIRKKSIHLFFQVGHFQDTLDKFMESGALQNEVKNFLTTWLKEGLKDWDISRDGPYFGFQIPDEVNKYFYVWLDAPIGYISSTQNWAKRTNADFEELWRNGDTEIHHFIGKDIVYFHTLFWIPMLKAAGFKMPNKIHVHGFLTVNGEKMSKTKGTFINARTYLDYLDPEYLRYYYASKLKNSVGDLDLSFQDFANRVNAEMVNKIANLGSRTISMFNKNKALNNSLGFSGNKEMVKFCQQFIDESDNISKNYANCDFGLAVKKVCHLADIANAFIDQHKPWELKNNLDSQRAVLTAGIHAFRLITLYLKPVIPLFAAKVEQILKIEPLMWGDSIDSIDKLLAMEGHKIGEFQRLAERVDIKTTEKVIQKTMENTKTDQQLNS